MFVVSSSCDLSLWHWVGCGCWQHAATEAYKRCVEIDLPLPQNQAHWLVAWPPVHDNYR